MLPLEPNRRPHFVGCRYEARGVREEHENRFSAHFGVPCLRRAPLCARLFRAVADGLDAMVAVDPLMAAPAANDLPAVALLPFFYEVLYDVRRFRSF